MNSSRLRLRLIIGLHKFIHMYMYISLNIHVYFLTLGRENITAEKLNYLNMNRYVNYPQNMCTLITRNLYNKRHHHSSFV